MSSLRQMMGNAQEHIITLNIADTVYDLYTLCDRCFGPPDIVRDIQHISFHFKGEKGKGSFYVAQYTVRWTAQSALHLFPSLKDLFIPTPTRLLLDAF